MSIIHAHYILTRVWTSDIIRIKTHFQINCPLSATSCCQGRNLKTAIYCGLWRYTAQESVYLNTRFLVLKTAFLTFKCAEILTLVKQPENRGNSANQKMRSRIELSA